MLRFVEALRIMGKSQALKACSVMTLGLCFHFLGYECARAASITLLAAKDMGLGNEAIPLTIALGSPTSGLVLYLYTKSIKKYGSKFTLRVSFIFCVAVLFWMAVYGGRVRGLLGKIAIISFYAFREIYVSLLSSQQWAFIAGTLDKSTSSYIVSFSGVVSIASAVGGCSIEQLVNFGGVPALLTGAFVSTVASFVCAEVSFRWTESKHNNNNNNNNNNTGRERHDGTTVAAASQQSSNSNSNGDANSVAISRSRSPARENPATNTGNSTRAVTGSKNTTTATTEDKGRNRVEPNIHGTLRKRINSTRPSHRINQNKNHNHHAISSATSTTRSNTLDDQHKKKRGGFWIDSWNLICKHRVLQVLFVEAITHQMCGNMLNLMFHNGLRSEIAEDSVRAMLVGRFFATVNIAACTLQCFVMPHLLSQSTLPNVLTKIPFLVLAAVCLGIVQPGLISVMLGFGTIKVLEYSIMHSASEMIYMPMGHDVRYLGKELIRFFGHKLGKSGASLVLSAAVSHVDPSLAMQSVWGAALTLCWGATMYHLSSYLKEREKREAEEERAKARATSIAAAAAVVAQSQKEVDDAEEELAGLEADCSIAEETLVPVETADSTALEPKLEEEEEEEEEEEIVIKDNGQEQERGEETGTIPPMCVLAAGDGGPPSEEEKEEVIAAAAVVAAVNNADTIAMLEETATIDSVSPQTTMYSVSSSQENSNNSIASMHQEEDDDEEGEDGSAVEDQDRSTQRNDCKILEVASKEETNEPLGQKERENSVAQEGDDRPENDKDEFGAACIEMNRDRRPSVRSEHSQSFSLGYDTEESLDAADVGEHEQRYGDVSLMPVLRPAVAGLPVGGGADNNNSNSSSGGDLATQDSFDSYSNPRYNYWSDGGASTPQRMAGMASSSGEEDLDFEFDAASAFSSSSPSSVSPESLEVYRRTRRLHNASPAGEAGGAGEQPIMLRVGSTAVDLYTLQNKTARRKAAGKHRE